MEVSGKRVPFKCVNGGTSKRWFASPQRGVCINVEERLSLEGEIVRYSSVSLSPTLSRNEKVKQRIRKKTHKPNALRFWVEGDVIPFMWFNLFLIITRSLQFPPLKLFNKGLLDGRIRGKKHQIIRGENLKGIYFI